MAKVTSDHCSPDEEVPYSIKYTRTTGGLIDLNDSDDRGGPTSTSNKGASRPTPTYGDNYTANRHEKNALPL